VTAHLATIGVPKTGPSTSPPATLLRQETPSTGTTSPVMKDASSEERKTMALATLAGSPIRPIGCTRSSPPGIPSRPASPGLLDPLGSDRSGRNGVDSDAAVGPLNRQVLGQARSDELGGAVGRLPLLPGQSGDRGAADDGATAGRHHRLERWLFAEPMTGIEQAHSAWEPA